MLGQSVDIITKQLLVTAVVIHHLTLEQELPWDAWAGTAEFAGGVCRGLLPVLAQQHLHLCYLSCTPGMSHSGPDSLLTSP